MDAQSKPTPEAPHPSERQVLVNIGNRYAVFGTRIALPNRPILGPNDVRTRFAERVGDEMDFPAERLVRSIQVLGAGVHYEPSDDPQTDIKLTFSNGASLLVEVKVQPRDLKSREFELYWKELREVGTKGGPVWEVWHFNIESPGLTILWMSRDGLPQRYDLEPLDVWEFNDDGSVFDRSRVIAHVEDWLRRIDDLYAQVQGWAKRAGLAADRTRAIRMSEELMQKFAVPDREVAILDLSRGDAPVMSVVPVGLWVFGYNGRVDLITPDKSANLFDTARSMETPNWVYAVRGEDRTVRPWSEAAFRELTHVDALA